MAAQDEAAADVAVAKRVEAMLRHEGLNLKGSSDASAWASPSDFWLDENYRATWYSKAIAYWENDAELLRRWIPRTLRPHLDLEAFRETYEDEVMREPLGSVLPRASTTRRSGFLAGGDGAAPSSETVTLSRGRLRSLRTRWLLLRKNRGAGTRSVLGASDLIRGRRRLLERMSPSNSTRRATPTSRVTFCA